MEKARTEWARDDGVVLVNGNVSEGIKADDRSFDFAGWAKLLEEDKQELDNYGPNQALIGDIQNQSGRAIQLCSRRAWPSLGRISWLSGLEGPRLSRAVLCRAEILDRRALHSRHRRRRACPVHPDQRDRSRSSDRPANRGQRARFARRRYILDEGPDTVNAQADVYETLTQVLPSVARMLTPPQAQAAVKVLLETSALPASAKKEFREASKPPEPNPAEEEAKTESRWRGEAAKVEETKSRPCSTWRRRKSQPARDGRRTEAATG